MALRCDFPRLSYTLLRSIACATTVLGVCITTKSRNNMWRKNFIGTKLENYSLCLGQ